MTQGSHEVRPWKLDVGCGKRKRLGHVGLDLGRLSDADVRADLESGLPFRCDTFEEVWMSHVFEHVEYPIRIMDEIWRVCRDGARLEIRGPHFSAPHLVWSDPTHRRGLSLATFQYFTDDSDWYVTRSRFAIASCYLSKGDTSFISMGRKPWYWPLVLWNKAWENIVNLSTPMMKRYERLLSRFIAFEEIRVVLVAEKLARPQGGIRGVET